MLHLSPKSHHSSLFSSRPGQRLEFSAIPTDDDELIQAIESNHEAPWQLEPIPDTAALSDFWTGVEDDLHNDPDWVSFADDGE